MELFIRPASAAEPAAAGGSCKAILQANPSAASGQWLINAEGQQEVVLCDMSTSGGGFTLAIRITRNQPTWNAWTSSVNPLNGAFGGDYGLPFEKLAASADGQELELFFKVDGVRRGPVYGGVDLAVGFDPAQSSGGTFDTAFTQDGVTCTANLSHSNAGWNWTIATSASATGCAGYTTTGFVLHGLDGTTTETAARLYGLAGYNGITTWGNIEIWVR